MVTAIFLSSAKAETKKVIIFHAGSLSVPFAKIERDFEAIYPEIDIIREAGGSTAMARRISESNEPANIMASADFTVIDKNLIPGKATWNILFASNQLVLCYTEKSRFSEEINSGNWYDILQRKDVLWGHSEPNLDPCGYRSLMVLQLAEKHYQIDKLSEALLANRPLNNVRPKAAELVLLLKSGKMDYALEYLSVAVQHNLNYIILPDEINLGNYKYDDFYSQAEVKVTGKEPGSFITQKGKSCTYGVTMIDETPNKQEAILFMDYLLNPEKGLKTLKQMGQPPFIPCRVIFQESKESLPESLKNLVEVKN